MQLSANPSSSSRARLASPRVARLVATFAAIAGVAAAQDGTAAEGAWPDVEGRIQYAFYTEDARALTDIADQLFRDEESQDAMRNYYVGLANYRLALVLSARDKSHAREAVERCVESLNGALKVKSDFAAGLALQSACLRTLALLTPWKPLAGPKSAGQMEKAVKLAPRDPRVLLLAAMERGEGERIDEQRLAQLKKAAAAFEAERQGMERTPGWGAAEAYTYLGRDYLDRGDVLAARDALERALLIAPDFALARRLLAKITSG